jgi:hypothetical protein
LFIRRISKKGPVLGQTLGLATALLFPAIFFGFMVSQPAFASNITVASPVNGTTVPSPVWIRAHNIGCNGLTPTSFGYSIDNSSMLTKGVTVHDIDVTTSGFTTGTHTIHFKSWTSNGICPVVSTSFKVAGGGTAGGTSGGNTSGGGTSSSGNTVYALPSNAIPSADLDSAGGWLAAHDTGTPGSSKGSMVYPASTPSYDDAREFYMTYSNHGGERWHLSFGNNATSMNFVLDTYVYMVNPNQVQNLEIDMNQVMSNGETVIYGTQCSSISKTWEYTIVTSNSPHWKSSNIGCNPLSWSAKAWHHIQIGYHRNSSGVVTHDWVNLDGAHNVFNGATGAAAMKLGWANGVLLTNFQIDGESGGSGSITTYIHKMTVYHW